MATEYFQDPQGRTQSRETTTDDEVNAATKTKINPGYGGAVSRTGTDASAPKSTGKPMPKGSDYPGNVGAYSKAMADWKKEQDAAPENIAQKRALKSM